MLHIHCVLCRNVNIGSTQVKITQCNLLWAPTHPCLLPVSISPDDIAVPCLTEFQISVPHYTTGPHNSVLWKLHFLLVHHELKGSRPQPHCEHLTQFVFSIGDNSINSCIFLITTSPTLRRMAVAGVCPSLLRQLVQVTSWTSCQFVTGQHTVETNSIGTFTAMENLQWPIRIICVALKCGRRLENLDRNCADFNSDN